MAKETGGTVIAVPTELRSDAAVAAMKDRVLAEFGRIDILVNAAATVTPADFLQLDEAEFLDVFEQKLNGYARCLRHILPPILDNVCVLFVNVSCLSAPLPHVSSFPFYLYHLSLS